MLANLDYLWLLRRTQCHKPSQIGLYGIGMHLAPLWADVKWCWMTQTNPAWWSAGWLFQKFVHCVYLIIILYHPCQRKLTERKQLDNHRTWPLRSTIWSTKKGPWGEIDFLCLWKFYNCWWDISVISQILGYHLMDTINIRNHGNITLKPHLWVS